MIDVKSMLDEAQAIMHGHFLLESGMHSDTYVECAKILQYTWHNKEIGNEIALRSHRFAPDCVISSSYNGVVTGYEVARNLDVPFLYIERDKEGNLSFTHCLKPTMFKNILIIEDIISDGKNVSDIIKVLKRYGSDSVGIASIVKMSQTEKIEGIPLISLVAIPSKIYEPHSCPLCKENLKIADYKNICS